MASVATVTTSAPAAIVLDDAGQIASFNRGPISGPTVLTLPTSCEALPTSVSGGGLYFGHNGASYFDNDCFPTSTLSEANTQSGWGLYYYSPAVSCPLGWSAVATARSSFGGLSNTYLALGSATTAVLCCPSGYTALSFDHQCQSNYPVNTKTLLTLAYKAPSTDVNGNWIATATSTATHNVSTTGDWTIFGDGIPIWYQASDQVLFTATSTSASSSTAASTSGPTASSSSSTTPTSAPSGLSSGAKTGIGIAVAVGVLAIAAIIGFFIFQRRRRYRAAPREAAAMPSELHDDYTKREYASPGELSGNSVQAPVIHELYSDEGNHNMTKTTYR